MPRFSTNIGKTVYGWKDDNACVLSLQPREAGGASNRYDNPRDAVREAAQRGLTVQWENPAEIDAWPA